MSQFRCQHVFTGNILVITFWLKNMSKSQQNKESYKGFLKCCVLLIFDHSQLKPGAKKLKVFQILL